MGKKTPNTSDPMSVSTGDFMRWARGQQSAFDPMISAWQGILRGIPTAKSIGAAYDTGYNKFLGTLGNINFGAGGQGVGAGVGAIGSAIGAPAGVTADVAGAANMATPGNVVAAALGAGAYGATQAAKAAEGMKARDMRQQGIMGMAEVKSKKRAAAPNPLEQANTWLSYLNNLRSYNRSGFSGGGAGGTTGTPSAEEIAAAGLRLQEIKDWNDWFKSPEGQTAAGSLGKNGGPAGGKYIPR